MSVYLYKMKLQMLISLTYRFEVFAALAARLILILANVFLWGTVYSGQETISDVSREQMITYSVLSACLSVMCYCGIQGSLNNDVRSGNVAILMMRPYSLLAGYFSEDVGTVIVKAVTVAFPILVICSIFLPLRGPASPEVLLLVFLSYLCGYMILWLLGALVSMFAFVTMELGNMGVVKDMLVAILSGSMIPIWFFPEGVERLLMKTPFPYTYQTPLGLYIGKIDPREGVGQILIQLLWMAMLGAVVAFVWKKVRNKVLVQGG